MTEPTRVVQHPLGRPKRKKLGEWTLVCPSFCVLSIRKWTVPLDPWTHLSPFRMSSAQSTAQKMAKGSCVISVCISTIVHKVIKVFREKRRECTSESRPQGLLPSKNTFLAILIHAVCIFSAGHTLFVAFLLSRRVLSLLSPHSFTLMTCVCFVLFLKTNQKVIR